MRSKKIITILGFLGLYFLSSGVSWAFFSYFGGGSTTQTQDQDGLAGERSKINLDLPRTEECPINGMMYTKIEKSIWEDRRPITTVIENHLDARPTSGLSKADVVYEAVAEGGITRFLGVFYCGVSADDVRIGPVRSARVYFVNWAAEYGVAPLFVHVGGANNICGQCPGGVKPKGTVGKEVDAFAMLSALGWRYSSGNDLDGGTNVGFPVMWRDMERISGAAYEHTFMGSTDKLFNEGSDRGFGSKGWDEGYQSWKFADDSPSGSPSAADISFEFWSNKSDYDVNWKYDQASNSYLRSNGGTSYIDMEYKDLNVSAKNVVIQFVEEKGPVDREMHMYYEVVDRGEALIFQNGSVIEGTWEKKAQTERTVFYDGEGEEVEFVRGVVWIEAVPIGNEIKY
ncbi:MAG: hypothetical protein UV74_C0013G0483 [Candidatus Woesebacteria bacterium GW2011_GWB1_43_14]|uniref:DUF3048 domain-containing protein n=1 Tax=Candidatus Woesebacteria bacterium GW2011_GWB1_43_14 TaxID=1618578 RepID=A0A0G1FQQ0_9BACT|nr:MAG: hypothetical protein UT21_C0001G0195 [Candidatus Woesebacteria bacterium GW2011_GWA1_39_11b]KKS78059.1 MAG: hypothetical protein UV51_C0003G0094 [Candidatus Woesebacteria bacterium GW2011_GWC1_42_9]KKS97361.1 MAG: hypothetical protein UV74_C0013G0483 [Candidatus Woesebacteria bacterium GW2011_GWB1_43_14]